jgi:hypothetical protein
LRTLTIRVQTRKRPDVMQLLPPRRSIIMTPWSIGEYLLNDYWVFVNALKAATINGLTTDVGGHATIINNCS